MKPLYIALCGAPHAGKSTVAEILEQEYEAIVIDDGKCLREAAMKLYGLSFTDVYTQRGKDRRVVVCGKSFTVRQLLGDLGNLLEGFYGQQFMPERALEEAKRIIHTDPVARDKPIFVFPSCRKIQGLTYTGNNGIVVEVTRSGYQSVNDFDHYDRSFIKYVINNDAEGEDWQETLRDTVKSVLGDVIFQRSF